MGVKNLWEILESCKKTIPLHHLQNKRVCIDLSCWMVQLISVNKSHGDMKDKLYLKGLFHRIRALIALNCSLIFVTDGSIPGIKVSTYRRRLNLDSQGNRDECSTNINTPLKRNMGSEFSCMIKEANVLGAALGVPCLDGVEEGEAQCALLDSESLCNGCFSCDSDIFLFGARTVYRDICLGEGGYVVCYEMDDIEKKLGFGRNSLIALAVLLGCDYSPGVRGIGPELACQIVRSFGESAVLQRLASEELLLKKKAKNGSKKQNQVPGFNNKENIPPQQSNISGHNSNLPKNHQFLQVMDAYLKPKCHSADSQMVQSVLATHPFQRTRLLQICHRFFEWPPEKTDEYILSKIAERNLRRFANLRHTSSQLGAWIPLDQMPVKCPISAIIKRRKVHGKECFEVSWEDIDGLSSSIIPGELVHSACPEKISEFEQRIAEKKKPKPRKIKKNEANKSVSEVEAKLQELMLEIEGTCSSGQNYRLVDEPLVNTRSNIKEVKVAKYHSCDIETEALGGQNYRLTDEPLVNNRSYVKEVSITDVHSFDIERCSSGQNNQLIDEPLVNTRSIIETENHSCDIETEVVNLSTPLVMKTNRNDETKIVDLVSPFSVVCGSRNLDVDVIDLSESEPDVSPEHAKKARELRLFVAKIRDDVY